MSAFTLRYNDKFAFLKCATDSSQDAIQIVNETIAIRVQDMHKRAAAIKKIKLYSKKMLKRRAASTAAP